MKQLAQYQDGRLELQEVAVPVPPPGGILVRTTCTVISPGTEKMKVDQARMSLLEKARARPDQVRKVLDTVRTLGWKAALEKVRNRLESPTPLGYSAAGVVVAVDEANPRFRIGDRVACGGAECAHHAEMLGVPDLLAAKIPDGVEDWQAAYTTLASISLEGVRQSGVRLGERVLVIGQGLIGLLATSLLRSAGARVMATDLNEGRLQVATAMGAERVVTTGVENAVREWTDGVGVDAVLVCIGGKGGSVSQTVINCLRDRGTMVIVGMHDAELPWKTAYMKDITVKYSRSYGPGRYDPQYEWGGRDYPIGHVRWTENRNFEACLELMRTGQLDLKPVTTKRLSFGEITGAYDSLANDVGIVVSYASIPDSRILNPDSTEAKPNLIKESGIRNQESGILDVIGAGNAAASLEGQNRLGDHREWHGALGAACEGEVWFCGSGDRCLQSHRWSRFDRHAASFACAAGDFGVEGREAGVCRKTALSHRGRIGRNRRGNGPNGRKRHGRLQSTFCACGHRNEKTARCGSRRQIARLPRLRGRFGPGSLVCECRGERWPRARRGLSHARPRVLPARHAETRQRPATRPGYRRCAG
jgi:threonine dehydrogenase-like Zn-dependent dehydrogenase